MLNTVAVLVPPPGAGVNTVMLAVPAVAMLAAGTVAVNCVLLTNVVASALPFQLMLLPLTKLVPVAVSVKAVPPALALLVLYCLMWVQGCWPKSR
jgi:hypothetical protein